MHLHLADLVRADPSFGIVHTLALWEAAYRERPGAAWRRRDLTEAALRVLAQLESLG